MAEQLAAYRPLDGGFHPGRPPMYPWDQWLNGKIWRLTQGKKKDFACELDSMVTLIYDTAARRGVKVSIRRHSPTELVIQAREK